jgi:hypothetical protein
MMSRLTTYFFFIMIAPQFGTICEDPQEAILANRLSIWLSKIEDNISSNKLECAISACDKTDYKEKVEPWIYYPHDSHTLALVIVIVDDLGKITIAIEEIDTPDVKLYLREWYLLLKAAICTHPDAQAYHWNR